MLNGDLIICMNLVTTVLWITEIANIYFILVKIQRVHKYHTLHDSNCELLCA